VGTITVKKKPAQTELDALNVTKWLTWQKEVSEFNWFFPEQEAAYIVEGECIVTPLEADNSLGVPIKFSKGDLVTFPAGLSTKWQVIKPLLKHYQREGNWFSQAPPIIQELLKHGRYV